MSRTNATRYRTLIREGRKPKLINIKQQAFIAYNKNKINDQYGDVHVTKSLCSCLQYIDEEYRGEFINWYIHFESDSANANTN